MQSRTELRISGNLHITECATYNEQIIDAELGAKNSTLSYYVPFESPTNDAIVMTMAKLFEIENTDILVSGNITLF
jgi:hypothetical protein